MNATKRPIVRAGWVACSVLVVALTGCRTHVVHERTRTVHVPVPPPVYLPPAPAPQAPPPLVYEPPAPAPQPPAPVVVVPPPAQTPVVVIQSETDFYEPLAAHGRWVVVGAYGRCWIPAYVEMGWRPYSNGYWQRTDAGWYWVSEEPWGWATYHYGRWDFHATYGWVWVPHTQWAPAWVCWREGGGYVGWAPLRPSVTIGVSINAVEYEPAFASRAFVFVEHRRMLEPVRPKTVIANNTTIINQTVNITNVKVVNKTVINEGPRPEVIERESGRKVKAVPAHEFRHREEVTVAARERNIPTASRRRSQLLARTEPQPAAKQSLPAHNTPVVEKPSVAVAPPAQPLATPLRPTPQPTEGGKPARHARQSGAEMSTKSTTTPPTVGPTAKLEAKPERAVPLQREVRSVEKPAAAVKLSPQPVTTNPRRNEKKPEAEIVKKTTTTHPPVAPVAKPEVKPARAVPPQREVRSVEKPALAVRPSPQPVMTLPVRDGRQHGTTSEKINPATPTAVEPRTRSEGRPVTRSETKPAVKVQSAPSSPPRIQAAPPTERPADKRLLAPREKPRAAEQTKANKKKEESGPRKQGEVQETLPHAPRRPTR